MDSTAIAAWFGAGLSTIVFLWDIYKWRTAGPKIRFTAWPNMKTVNMPRYDGQTLISADVTNYGDRSTTVTNLGFVYYEKKSLFRKKPPNEAAVVMSPSLTQPLPFELRPGAVWNGLVIQDQQVEEWVRKGELYLTLYVSHSEKPIKRRILFPPREEKKATK